MNERIRELARQSCEQVFGGKFGEMKLTMLFAEKFAELIVRECAQVCRDQPNIYALRIDRENCAVAIEEHFGVEE